MIKKEKYMIYLNVPIDYKNVYFHILKHLGGLGKDLLNDCSSMCKGTNAQGLVCFNMFNAACAAYTIGQSKLASTLISYIKGQLKIADDDIIINEDSSIDQWTYIEIDKVFECVYNALLAKLTIWGQELLDDCTSSCKNKNILTAWNMFQAGNIAYWREELDKAKTIMDYVINLINCDCDEIEYRDGLKLTEFTIEYNQRLNNNNKVNLNLTSFSVKINDDELVKEGSYYIRNVNTDTVYNVDALSGTINIKEENLEQETKYQYVFGCTDDEDNTVESNIFEIETIKFIAPILNLDELSYNFNVVTDKLTIDSYMIDTDIYDEYYKENSGKLVNSSTGDVLANGLRIAAGELIFLDEEIVMDVTPGTTINVKFVATGINDEDYSSEDFEIDIPQYIEPELLNLRLTTEYDEVNELLNVSGTFLIPIGWSNINKSSFQFISERVSETVVEVDNLQVNYNEDNKTASFNADNITLDNGESISYRVLVKDIKGKQLKTNSITVAASTYVVPTVTLKSFTLNKSVNGIGGANSVINFTNIKNIKDKKFELYLKKNSNQWQREQTVTGFSEGDNSNSISIYEVITEDTTYRCKVKIIDLRGDEIESNVLLDSIKYSLISNGKVLVFEEHASHAPSETNLYSMTKKEVDSVTNKFTTEDYTESSYQRIYISIPKTKQITSAMSVGGLSSQEYVGYLQKTEGLVLEVYIDGVKTDYELFSLPIDTKKQFELTIEDL